MNIRKSIALLSLLLVGSILFSLGVPKNFGFRIGFINDYGDKMVYAVRGSWYPYSKKPYTEVSSEYPQFATYFFALPYVKMGFPSPLDTRLIGEIEAFVNSKTPANPNDPSAHHMRNKLLRRYSFVFSLLMVPFLFFSILLVYELRSDRKHLAFLMLLPAGLYFTHNRYDIIPACLGLLSIYLLSKNRYNWSASAIAIGFLTKWYIVLLFPVFLAYYYTRRKKINWPMILTFLCVCFAILLPVFLSSGVDGLLAPHITQLSRSTNQPSLFFLASLFMRRGLDINIDNIYFAALTLVLQFSAVPLSVTSRIDSIDKVVRWSAFSVLVFIIFARINSPQWILWISPLLLVITASRFDVTGIILLDLFSYLQFPLLFNFRTLSDTYYNLFLLVFSAKLVLLICFAVQLIGGLIGDNILYNYLRGKENSITGPVRPG
jgi:hypothetical protein